MNDDDQKALVFARTTGANIVVDDRRLLTLSLQMTLSRPCYNMMPGAYSHTDHLIWMNTAGVDQQEESFSMVLLHELTHWTAKLLRPGFVHRRLLGIDCDTDRATEELTAEMGARYLAGYLGITVNEQKYEEYIAHWHLMGGDPRHAATQAKEALRYLINLVEYNNKEKKILLLPAPDDILLLESTEEKVYE